MEYYSPHTIVEAVTLLKAYDGRAKLIAGGTDLILDLQGGKYEIDALVDVCKIENFSRISLNGDYLAIGGGATHTQIATSAIVREYASALAAGCAVVGSRQIRNLATLAGNIVNAQPAADGAVGLAVMDADIVLHGENGERIVKLQDTYAGFGKSNIDSSREMIAEIRIPVIPARVSAFTRLALREALALPMLNCAAAACFRGTIVESMQIVTAPVGVGPTHAVFAEAYCTGRELSEDVIQEASHLVLQEANPRSNPLRGSREYRMDVLPVMAADCLRAIKAQLQ